MSFLDSIGHFIQHSGIDPVKSSIKRPLQAGKDLIHGKPGAAFQDLRHIVSDNEKAQSKGLGDLGVRGWVGKHPLESAAAVVATIFGGWAAWGAYGAGAAGGTTGAAAGAGAAGSAGGSTALGGGVAASNGVAAGTAIGQTVPAIPSVASMTSGTGAAVTASPSYSILAAPGYGTGGSWATTLGGEAQIANTGLASSGGGWMDKAKDFYNIYNKANQAKNALSQNQSAQQWKGVAFQNNPGYSPANISDAQIKAPTIPTTTTQILNGIDINSNLNSGPFVNGGSFSFGGFN